jgi:PAS domain S-box-containing protein
MALRPEAEQRHVPEDVRSELEPIQRALQENEDWYQDLVEHSHDLLCIHDLQGRLLSANPAPARVLGYSVEEILQIPMREFIAPEFRHEFDAYMERIARFGEDRGFLVVMTRSGERRVWKYHNTLRTEGVASPIVRGMAHDITAEKLAERLSHEASEAQAAKMGKSEHSIAELELFRALLDHCNDAIEVVDPETLRFLDVNEKACAELGYTREELLSLRVLDIDPAVTESLAAKISERLRQSGSMVMESVHRRKDGSAFPVEISMRRVTLDREYVITVSRDLTERKSNEALLRDSQDRYRAIYDHSPVGICWVDSRSGRFLGVNAKYCEILGRSEEEVLKCNFQSLTHPDDLPGNLEMMRKMVAGELRHYQVEKRYVRPDGSVRWAEVEVAPMWPEGGDPVWHMAIIQDITERKEHAQRLVEYERVVESLEQMIIVVDRSYHYVIANRAFLNYRDLEPGDAIGHHVTDVIAPAVFETIVKQKMDECFQGKLVEYEMVYPCREKGLRELLVRYFPVEGPTGVDRLAGILTDVTEIKQAERALRRNEENYRRFIAQSSEGIFREDADTPIPIDLAEDEVVHRILHDSYLGECNDALARMYGLKSAQELIGKRLLEMVPPEDPRNIELAREYIHSGFNVIERESHEVDVHGNPKVFLNSMIGTVENGKLIHTWGIQRDVTEKVKAEEARRKAEEALRENVVQLEAVTAELRQAKEKLSEEKLYLEQAIDTELGFGEIIGRSEPLKEVMQKVAKAAPSNANVLLLGETGTGKELVARALHQMSDRKDASFIKVNCAAIPSGLLESELFGHEKGAFTGAIARKLGRLELADQGTLFLDEIGEIPLSLQPKLLRVLQDQEFERLGGTQTLRVDFRLLAATNRELLASVGQKEFRSDLYYRLNVFPIRIPPLRDRREDIPLLVEHFVRKYSARMGKPITSIPTKTMEVMVQWAWPGNIRELENFIERSVILTPGTVLQAPLGEFRPETVDAKAPSLREKEREHILHILRESKGQLGGPNGAAARLGLKRTTLQSKLSQMGINPKNYRGPN